MDAFDTYINSLIAPQSVGAGVGTVFLSFFTGKLAPKLPANMYKLLDNTLVRMAATAYLLNQQIHRPSLSVVISVIMVLGFEVFIKLFVPDSPSLSELVKSTTGEDASTSSQQQQQNKGCNCYCGHTIYVQDESKKSANKMAASSTNNRASALIAGSFEERTGNASTIRIPSNPLSNSYSYP